MKQGHVQFYFMCKLYVDPKGMQSYYTVCSPISSSIERLFLLVLRSSVEQAAPSRGVCEGRLLKVFASWKRKTKTTTIKHLPCSLYLDSFLLARKS